VSHPPNQDLFLANLARPLLNSIHIRDFASGYTGVAPKAFVLRATLVQRTIFAHKWCGTLRKNKQ
jgi:hypothetical protein